MVEKTRLAHLLGFEPTISIKKGQTKVKKN
jgi:hypothetical protein